MAAYENDALMQYIDEYGDTYIIYPITKAENIDGTDEFFAPAGFGLGENCKSISGWNNAKANGFYTSNVNAPDSSWWWGYVIALNSGDIEQRVFRQGAGTLMYEAHRQCASGAWQPWEYVNPPMTTDEEFRTTERLNGKPIYAMVVNCGYFPSASTKTISIADTNIAQLVSCVGFTNYVGATLPSTSLSNNKSYIDASVEATKNAIIVTCGLTYWTEYTCYAILKYTKTTD